MRRGELYRVHKLSSHDPKNFRVFVIVSRQVLIGSKHSTVICAPIYSSYEGLSTQVLVGMDEGLKYSSGIHCDELISLSKSVLTHFIGTLPMEKLRQLDLALRIALEVVD